MAADFKLPVLLVIGNKLGAINHALLTLNAIKERGLECLGIVFNNVKDEWDTACVTNRSMVEEFSDAPILGELIHGQDYMDMDALLDRAGDGSVIRKSGVMAVVIEDGTVRPGDAIELESVPLAHEPLAPV